MSEQIATALLAAMERLLRPLVRILLRNGIAYGQSAEVLRKVYTDVAYDDFTLPGRKQTVSRVAVLTGLTRKEVKRLHELPPGDLADSHERYNRSIRVITGWLTDAQFLAADGEPAELPLSGATGSFEALVKKHSGDMPPRAVFQALAAAGSVAERDGRAVLLRRAYVPGGDPVDKIAILGSDCAELLDTIDHNLVSPRDALHYQRKVSSATLRADQVEAFRELSAARSQALLEELNAWLSQREVAEGSDQPGRAVSLGIYFYRERDTDSEESST